MIQVERALVLYLLARTLNRLEKNIVEEKEEKITKLNIVIENVEKEKKQLKKQISHSALLRQVEYCYLILY